MNRWFGAILIALLLALPVSAQSAANTTESLSLDLANPLSILKQASQAVPIQTSEGSPQEGDAGLSATISVLLLLTVLSFTPAILIMCTSFTRIIVVLALLRQAIGTQSLPPSQIILGLSMFLTFLVMAPTLERINANAITPLTEGVIDEKQAWVNAKEPLRSFMFDQLEYADNWDDVYMILNYRGIDTSEPDKLTTDDVDMLTLIPAFILSELKVAFLIGFRLYLPFLIIDMVVSSVLISMGMLMLPPVLISLPFKLLLFVLVDGWQLVAGNLLNSFAVPGVTTPM